MSTGCLASRSFFSFDLFPFPPLFPFLPLFPFPPLPSLKIRALKVQLVVLGRAVSFPSAVTVCGEASAEIDFDALWP